PLFVTQFFGAFNDNMFKNALIIIITYRLAEKTGADARMLVTLAALLFMLPYLLFSATAGQFADKLDRAFLARATKLWEIVLVSVAAAGFYAEGTYFLLVVLFCLGTQATFFGPIKYALLPQHLRDDELVAGNAYINAGSFLAILLGTITGGLLILMPAGNHLIAAAMLAVALLGYIASRFIPASPPAMPDLKINWNIAAETWRMVQRDRANKRVFRCILGISWFWLMGATYLSQFPTLAKFVLHADETVVTFFLTLFSVGIAAGSFLCNRILAGSISNRTVKWGAAGLSLFTLDLFFATHNLVPLEGALMNAATFMDREGMWRVVLDLLLVPVSAGLYIVPLYAIMQHESDPDFRARTIATNNVVNALFMVLSGIITMAMLAADFTVPQVFLTLGVLNIPVALYILRL
ncbi:MAG: MFS transporter, partial [Proteobacteria bacterium]|nr:MFS transporter [Pseudomonadota bacterium]